MSDTAFLLVPIGSVESALTDVASAPKQGSEGAPDAWLVFHEAVQAGLSDLQVSDEVLVLTWLDRGDRTALLVHPRDDPAAPMRGVFSTRSADRPNPVGLHRVRILAQEGHLRFLVGPLEAVNGTPIIDVKPILGQAAEG